MSGVKFMDAKKALYPLIVILFILGLVIGYTIHKPQTIEYVNRTVTTTATAIVTATATPITTWPTATTSPTPAESPTATPVVPDFTVKNYDFSTDNPTVTIELANMAVNPNTVRIHTGETVLIKITDYSLLSPMTLILNFSYRRNLGTSGAVTVTFSRKGTYRVQAEIPSNDPNILPKVYTEREGIIIVN
jgi:hypothetical protein